MKYNYLLHGRKSQDIVAARDHVSSMLGAFFKSYNSIITRPIYWFDNNQWNLTVYYLNNRQISQALQNWKLIKKFYLAISSDIGCKPIGKTVNLRLVPLHKPYLSAQIIAEWLSNKISNHKLYDVIDRTLRWLDGMIGPIIASGKESRGIGVGSIGGIKVQISGKLTTGSNRPRYTVKTYTRGSLAGTNVSYGQHTAVNTLGSFTIKVWISSRTRVM